MEKALGLSVSPLMDRTHKGGITRSQVYQQSLLTSPGVPEHAFYNKISHAKCAVMVFSDVHVTLMLGRTVGDVLCDADRLLQHCGYSHVQSNGDCI